MNGKPPQNNDQPFQGKELEECPFECLAAWPRYEPYAKNQANEREWLNTQAQSLVCWARENGYLISDKEWESRIGGWETLEGGREHNVFLSHELNRVFKYTIPPKFGIQEHIPLYAMNQLLANLLFSDDIQFEGVITFDDSVSIVISQPYVEGTKPTEIEIEDWFRESGFKTTGMYQWWNPELNIEILDAHTGNLLKDPNNALIPIDVQITKYPGIL